MRLVLKPPPPSPKSRQAASSSVIMSEWNRSIESRQARCTTSSSQPNTKIKDPDFASLLSPPTGLGAQARNLGSHRNQQQRAARYCRLGRHKSHEDDARSSSGRGHMKQVSRRDGFVVVTEHRGRVRGSSIGARIRGRVTRTRPFAQPYNLTPVATDPKRKYPDNLYVTINKSLHAR